MDATLNLQEDSWMALAQPRHSHSDNPRFLCLLAALDEGWEVAPPVYRRPRWIDDREFVYHFILKRPDRNGARLITVPEDNAIRELVRDRKLATF